MEELNLEDLVFDSGNDVFDAFKEKEAKPLPEGEIKKPSEEKEKITNSEEIKTPENVAKGKEDKDIKIQDGKEAPKSDGKGSNSSSPETPNDTEKLYSTLATQFKAKGVFANLDIDKENIKSMEDIEKALDKEINLRLTDKQRKIEEAINAGVPAGDIDKQMKSVEGLKNITSDFVSSPENSEFRKNVIAQDFINKGYAKEKALAYAQRSIDAGQDEQDALDSLNEIISFEENKVNDLINTEKQKEEKSISDLKSFIHEKEEIIPGIKLTTAQKEELYNQVVTDIGGKDNAFMKAQKEDPLGSRVKLEAFFYLTKGFKDFSIFGKQQETKISNSIESLLRGASFTEDGKINTDKNDSMSSFTLKDLEGVKFE